jgi:Leucine-rich repeat (LRR) protein
MIGTSPCPEPEQLQRFLLGQLQGAEAEQLEQHLPSCRRCLSISQTFHLCDTFVDLVRTGGSTSEAVLAEPDPVLLQQLFRLGTPLSGPGCTVPADPPPRGPAQEVEQTVDLGGLLAPPQEPGEMGRLGPYRVLKVLGTGGMGVVFLAEDPGLQRRVALKAMKASLAANSSAGERFLREARAIAAVQHDHIVTIYQVGTDRGVPFLAMELLEGCSLEDWLRKGRKPTLAQLLCLGREIAQGLTAAHTHGLIHRDIKPANLWLDATHKGRVKILDFGLARPVTDDLHLTQSGAIAGTPPYMAPEQTRGEPVDTRSDLFSLGVVLYRLCSGQLPFQGKDAVSTLLAVSTHHPVPPGRFDPDLPPELSDLVMRLLEKDPSRRPASAGEVVESLQALEKQLARRKESTEATVPVTAAGPAGAASAPARPRHRSFTLVAAAAAGALALLAASLVLFWPTANGTVRLEINDADIQVAIDKGNITITGPESKNITLTAGEHALHVQRGDLAFDTDKFTLKKGETVTLLVEFLKGKVQVVQDGRVIGEQGIDDAWLKQVATLPAEKQVEAVAAKLKERNPGFDGEVQHKIEDGDVTELRFVTDNVTDLSPVRALTSLFLLHCPGSDFGKGQLEDLSPLKDLKHLKDLRCDKTKVSDLSPLRDLKLASLDCGGTKVSDLSPLKDMKLTVFGCIWTKVSDLSPLQGMPLTNLHCGGTRVSDLSPLQGMPLTELRIWNTRVSDLSPLKGMKLAKFACNGTFRVSDLSPLRGMPLKDIFCDFKPERDAEILRSFTTLETINQKPAAAFWKEVGAPPRPPLEEAWLKQVAGLPAEKQVEAVVAKLKERNPGFDGKVRQHIADGVVTALGLVTDNVTDLAPVRALTGLDTLPCNGSGPGEGQLADLSPLAGLNLGYLDCGWTKVSDLSPLRGMPLQTLRCPATPVSDLSPLKDMKLTYLWIGGTRVTDLSPLRGMSLTGLDCAGAKVTDLSPLKGMPLKDLRCGGTSVSDLSPLKNTKLELLECWGTPVSDLSSLKGMKLTYLQIRGTPVSDLSPLKDMPLTGLDCSGTKVTDLSPLRGMPLKDLVCDFDPERDAAILQAIKTLETINGKPAAEFWKAVEAKPASDAWLKQVAVLPAEKQVAAVAAKLKERNPGFDGKVTHQIQDGVVRELRLVTDNLTDISPVRALRGLHRLSCDGTKEGGQSKGQLADLSPLKDLPLLELHCCYTQVSDLSPLKDMKLTFFACGGTQVVDLSPLKDMKLIQLHCWTTPVSDLTPLRGMPLKWLNLGGCPQLADLTPLKDMKLMHLECGWSMVADLTPLAGMPLTTLYCGGTQVSDLSVLKGMPLTDLRCPQTGVSDLSPLKGMPLTTLWCYETRVSDLSPLRGMPLQEVRCDFKPQRDGDVLRSIKSLETINQKPAAAFWEDVVAQPAFEAWLKQVAALPAEKQVEAVAAKLKERNPGFDGKVTPIIDKGVVRSLELRTDAVTDLSPVQALTGLRSLVYVGSAPGEGQLTDLSPLKNLDLSSLWLANTAVSDLSPLKDLRLWHLSCQFTKVTDLSPLKDMKLGLLYCNNTKVSDLSPLKGMPLKELRCNNTLVSDLSPLKGLPLAELNCWSTRVTDLSPLRGLPLKILGCPFDPERDTVLLRSIKTLEKINDKPAAEFWKEVGDKERDKRP